MRLVSFNVNGIRAISKKGFFDWLKEDDPDVLCMQETKCHPDQLDLTLISPEGYHTCWSAAEKKGYSGVSVWSKQEPVSVVEGLGNDEFDKEGRTLIVDFKDFVLFNIYYPNGGSGNKRVPFKMGFYDAFFKRVHEFVKQGRQVVVCGDVNTAHKPIDLARPEANEKNTGFLPEEREWVGKFLDSGFTDTFRHFHPDEPDHYTWWDYKTRARSRNVGWRIDYFFVNDGFIDGVKDAFILKDVMGSDHCPIGITLK